MKSIENEKKYYSDICGNLGDGRLAVCIGCTAVVSLTRGMVFVNNLLLNKTDAANQRRSQILAANLSTTSLG